MEEFAPVVSPYSIKWLGDMKRNSAIVVSSGDSRHYHMTSNPSNLMTKTVIVLFIGKSFTVSSLLVWSCPHLCSTRWHRGEAHIYGSSD